jgi:D-alanine-D-alanine ligase
MSMPNPIVGIAFNAFEPPAGRSDELLSETSVQQTAADLLAVLTEAGYKAILLPLQDDLLDLARRYQEHHCTLLINLCEAFRGIPQLEAHVAAFFEAMDWPFTGNGSATLILCQQKYASKALLKAQNLPCAQGFLVRPGERIPAIELPVIVKPNAEDASLGIYADSVVTDPNRLQAQVEKIWSTYRQPALVEKYIDGREFNVGVLQEGNSVRALPVSEISFAGMPAGLPHIVGYEAKWFEDHPLYHATVPLCPAPVSATLQNSLQNLAVEAFKTMGCRDYARIDFRVDQAERIFILEVNPNPDISLGAGYARALKAAGIPYVDFWRIMMNNVSGRRK